MAQQDDNNYYSNYNTVNVLCDRESNCGKMLTVDRIQVKDIQEYNIVFLKLFCRNENIFNKTLSGIKDLSYLRRTHREWYPNDT